MKKTLTSIIALTLLAISPTQAQDTRKELTIGGLLHLTGEWAPQGTAFLEGIQLAAEEINQKNQAYRIRLEIEDTRYIPVETHKGAMKLSQNKELDAVLTTCMSETKTAAPVFQKNKTPVITLWDSSPELEAMDRNVFGIGTWAPSSGEVAADYAVRTLGAKTAIVIDSNTEWSQSVSAPFVSEFNKRGGSVLKVFSLDPKDQDFRAVLTKTRALNPDVIYAPVDGNIVPFYKQLNTAKVATPVISSDVIAQDYIDENPDIFEGIYQTQTADPSSPRAQKMLTSYRQHFSKDAAYPLYTAWGYDAVYLVLEAAKKNGKESLLDAIYTVKNLPGATGKISINERGSSRVAVSMFQIRDRSFVNIS